MELAEPHRPMRELRVYRLVDAGILAFYREVIRREVFGLAADSPAIQFEVAPISGWIYYADHAELFANKAPGLLPQNEAGITKAATDWFRRCQERYVKLRRKNATLRDLPQVFPDVMRVAQIEPAFCARSRIVDHWLLRFDIYLRASEELGRGLAPVLGSGLDLRIGNRGMVRGLFLRWRPVDAVRPAPLIPPEDAEALVGHTHAAEFGRSSPGAAAAEIVYQLQGESSYQTHLCPYYLRSSGHHRELTPATAESSIVRFRQEVFEDFVEVEAQIVGGSGEFELSWSRWSVADPRGGSYREQSGGTRYRLPGGVHNLLLIARDRRSGQLVQRQETIYAAVGGAPVPETIERPGCTDPSSPNYDASANVDDGSCADAPSA